jgi:hypothetical protein
MQTKHVLRFERRSFIMAQGQHQSGIRQVTSSGWIPILLLLLFTACGSVYAQPLVWVEHGPGPNTQGQVENITDREVVGAIHAVAPHPTNADILYVGAVNGGIWMTLNALAASPHWEYQSDDWESLSIGALEFDPTDATHQTLIAGTGRFSSYSRHGGDRIGLLRTTDGGTTWNHIDGGGTLDGINISGVAARGATIVISANEANTFGDYGIWQSTDTGTTWTQISGGAGTGLPAGASYDLAGDPSDNTRLFTNAGANGVYRSTDTGATWAKVSDAAMDALITGATNNIEIAMGTSNNVYVAIVNGGQLAGLFRSGDGGNTWVSLDLPATVEDGGVSFGIHPGGQGYIHLSIIADPGNTNIVYIGGDRQPTFLEGTGWVPGGPNYWPNSIGANDYSGRLFRVDASLPAGSQVAHLTHSNTSLNSSPHADSRDMAFAANDDLIEVDDGGVYRRTSPQTNIGDWFSAIGDLKATEFHDIAWDSNSNIVIGGAQDTGTPEQILPTNRKWRSVSTADGGDVAVDDTGTPGLSTRYSSNQNLGNFRRRVLDTSNTLVSVDFPALAVLGGGAALQRQFITPVTVNNVDPTRIIIGGRNSVYESLDQGDTITEIGPGIRVNSTGFEPFGRDPIAYGAAGNAEMLYVAEEDRVYVRDAAHPDPLDDSTNYPGRGTGRWVVDIAIDPGDPDTAYVIDRDHVYRTTDAGANWADITGDLQTLTPGRLRSLAYSTSNADGSAIVGGNNGVYIARGPAFTDWEPLGEGLPRAPVFDLDYDPADEILVAGLLGRGAWTLNLSERDPVDVMLVLDLSGSMLSPACPGCDPKLDVLKEAVEIFVQLWKALAVPDDRLGIDYFRNLNIDNFSVGGDVLLPIVDHAPAMITDVNNQTTVLANLTPMGGGLQDAINRLSDLTRNPSIILFTDGMQNVNPMVLEIDDSPPPGAFHLEIDNDPGISTSSDVPPTVPPTRLDTDLSIKVNTIGVGATPRFVDLLDNIASEAGGLAKLTTAPDDDLRRFYVEELIDVLRGYSPQLLAYRYRSVETTTATETFTTNNSARKIILKLSWKRGDNLDFQVEKDGVDLTQFGQIIDGPFYRIFSMNVPAEVQGSTVNAGGEWVMRISGAVGTTYEAAAIVDESLLEYDFSLGRKDYTVGEPLELSVSLTFEGQPVTDASQVTATILKPRQGLGTLLSINPTPSEPSGFQSEEAATAGQKKFQLLLQDEQFYRDLQPVEQTLALQNTGDGSYSTVFSDTDITGTYTVIFQVEGERSDIGEYRRTETLSTMVRFGKAELDASDLRVTLLKETADGRHMLLSIRPKDRFGNYLGPDYGHRIKVSLSAGSVDNDNKQDLVDGSYTIPLFVPPATNPVVTVSVMDQTVFEGPLSELELKRRLVFSLHSGAAIPVGSFSNDFDPGVNVLLDVGYHFSPQFSLVGLFSYNDFKSKTPGIADNYWINLSANVRYQRPIRRPLSYYIGGGPGVYIPETGNTEFGANLGFGLDYDYRSFVTLELGADYHAVFGEDIQFLHNHAGIIFRF